MEKKLGILGFTEINELIDSGVIEFAHRKQINACSLNVTLGKEFLVEKPDYNRSVSGIHFGSLKFADRQSPTFNKVEGVVSLAPQEFCLASIIEKINLPEDIACHVLLRSSAARMGIDHSLAGWADCGYSGHLTLEIKNLLRFHSISLFTGDQICQLVFHRTYPVPLNHTYGFKSGKYSGDVGPQTVKQEIPELPVLKPATFTGVTMGSLRLQEGQ